MNNTDKILKRLHEHYLIVQNMGYEIVGLFLQGSQNYELDYENSDIDSKAIVLPKFNDFVLNKKPISTTHILPNDEHIDIKDIRVMFDCFKKQNINFIEILFTKYKILNPKYEYYFTELLKHNELIARYNNYAAVNCICGMSLEKYKALEYPYPSIIDKIEKFGYDPKQLHHIIRLNEFLKRFIANEDYSKCLISPNKDYLIDIKKGLHTLDEARTLAEKLQNDTYNIKNDYMKNNAINIDNNALDLLNDTLIKIIKHSFILELQNNK